MSGERVCVCDQDRGGRECVCVHERERRRATEQWSEAISSLYFLDTQKASLCVQWVSFFIYLFFLSRFHVKAIEVA